MEKGGSVLSSAISLSHTITPLYKKRFQLLVDTQERGSPQRAHQTELHHIVLIRARKKMSYQNRISEQGWQVGGRARPLFLIPV